VNESLKVESEREAFELPLVIINVISMAVKAAAEWERERLPLMIRQSPLFIVSSFERNELFSALNFNDAPFKASD